jgi:hypothetical protein
MIQYIIFVKKHNIEMPKPVILMNFMDAEIAGIEEDLFINKFRYLGFHILNKVKGGSQGSSKSLINEYNDKMEYDIFKENNLDINNIEPVLYNKISSIF